jgi:hypothetical protein
VKFIKAIIETLITVSHEIKDISFSSPLNEKIVMNKIKIQFNGAKVKLPK